MYELQTSIEVNGASFGIRNKGDFRVVLDCFKTLNDPELTDTEKAYICLIIFYEDFSSVDDVLKQSDIIPNLQTKMHVFFNCGDEESVSNTNDKKLVDWEKDSNLIIPAVNSVAHAEIRNLEYLHWWTFMGYYMSVGESLLSTVISIRKKLANTENLDKWEKKFVEDNPGYFNMDYRSKEQKEADEYIKNLWSNNNV